MVAAHMSITKLTSRHTLQGHHGHGASLLSDARFLNVSNVHDNTALEHLCQAHLLTAEMHHRKISAIRCITERCHSKCHCSSLPSGSLQKESQGVYFA